MTPRSPKSPARKKAGSLPAAVYVVPWNGVVYFWSTVRADAVRFARLNGYRVTKYTPVPPRSRKSKGGGRG